MRVLDLFCGAGGAGMGYHRAGFEVVGVDLMPQPHYPFEFHRADAMEFSLDGYDVIHASPPCQHYTKYGNKVKDIKDRYDDLISPTRQRLKTSGRAWVMENVERSPLVDPIRLCGSMFEGKGTHDIQRHRLFESNVDIPVPMRCDHSIWEPKRYPGGRSIERGGSKVLVRKTIEIGKWSIPLETQKSAMGVDWNVTVRELSESVPPAYTEYIGQTLLAVLS